MSKPTLGFADLSKIKPDTEPEPHISDEQVDRAGERAGFTSREPTAKIVKRPTSKEATAGLGMRPTISVYNRFVQLSLAKRMSYPEALAYLLDLAGVDEDGLTKLDRQRGDDRQ